MLITFNVIINARILYSEICVLIVVPASYSQYIRPLMWQAIKRFHLKKAQIKENPSLKRYGSIFLFKTFEVTIYPLLNFW